MASNNEIIDLTTTERPRQRRRGGPSKTDEIIVIVDDDEPRKTHAGAGAKAGCAGGVGEGLSDVSPKFSCAICLSEDLAQDDVLRLLCKHIFCRRDSNTLVVSSCTKT